MASKKKKEAQEWFQCMTCGQVIYRTDTAQHVDSCTATPTFVLDSVLHAHLTTTKTSQIKASLDKMSFASRDGVVLIHRSTMAMCGLCIGQPCLVNGRHVLTSWPCDGLPPTSVYLPPLLLDVIVGSAPGSDCVVTVKCFRPSGSEAQHVDVELELENPKSLSELSVQAFAFKMEGQYITEDMRHTIRLLGRPCTFHIRTIQTVKHPVFQLNLPSPSPSPPQPSHTEELSQDLSSLNLSNYGDNSMSSLPATPLRQAGEDTPSTHSPAVSTPSVESPAVSTPKQSNSTPKQSDMQRSDQFHTPASQTSPPSGEEDTRRFVKVTCRTQFRFRGPGDEDAETAETEKKVTFDSLGGLDKQIEKLKMCCVMPLQIAKDNASAGVPMPYGILLFGPTGTGKSMLAQALANELGIYTASISPHDLYSKKRSYSSSSSSSDDDLILRAKRREEEEKKNEIEKQRLMRQKELEEKLIEEEVARRVEELVAKRVEEELEKRKEEIEEEVLRRVEEAKKIMEMQMLSELESQRQAELEAQKQKEEEDRKKRQELEAIMAENNKKMEEAQRKLAEEQLKLVEDQRKILEERQRLEEEEKKRQKREQEVILNKKNARPRLSFSLNSK